MKPLTHCMTAAGAEATELTPGASARPWLTWQRAQVYSATVLVLFAILLAAWAWVSKGFTDAGVARPGTDFAVFWSAAHIALADGPVHAYDIDRLMAVFRQHGTLGPSPSVTLAWLYPPAFLLAVMPLALLPLGAAFLLFTLAGLSAYLRALVPFVGAAGRQAWLPVLASPALLVAVVMGQNSLLTAALAAGAVWWLDRRPWLAGCLAGLLAIKPQLGILVPLALVAGGHWRAFAGGALSAMVSTGTGIIGCGWETVPAFFSNLQWARTHLVDDTPGGWLGMPTTLAALRLAGATAAQAYAGQLAVALAAGAGLVATWRRTRDPGLRLAALATATVLATPYLRSYELPWLGLAVAALAGYGLRSGLQGGLRGGLARWEKGLLVAAWLLPAFEHANPALGLPQVGPLVPAAMLAMTVRHALKRAESRPC